MARIVLVTGGAGFVGSHLCERLVQEGNKVICVDNLLTGSQKNIAHLLSRDNFTFINQDVSKISLGRKINKLDQVFHLASPADPNASSAVSYIAHPFETMMVNTAGTWKMCELALKYGAKLSFASTSEIYGDPEVSPQSESYTGNVSTTGPRSVYDESKRFGETIVAAFVREKKLNGVITRIFNTYGPRMNIREGRAVVNFIKQAIGDKPLTVYGDGTQTRSFCYIDDQIEGQIMAMEKGKSGEIFNIGNDDERQILEFAKIVKRLAGSKSEIVFKDLPKDDPKQRRPDINKAKSVLGWKPKVELEEGLAITVDYFRSVI